MLGHPLCIILPQVFTVKQGARMGDYWAQSQNSPSLPSRAQALSLSTLQWREANPNAQIPGPWLKWSLDQMVCLCTHAVWPVNLPLRPSLMALLVLLALSLNFSFLIIHAPKLVRRVTSLVTYKKSQLYSFSLPGKLRSHFSFFCFLYYTVNYRDLKMKRTFGALSHMLHSKPGSCACGYWTQG